MLGCYTHPDGWAAVKLSREFGLPVVLKVHGSCVRVAPFQDPRRGIRIAGALREADRVAAVSRDLAEHAERLGAAPTHTRVVYNGVNQALFRPGGRDEARARLGLDGEAKLVLFVGNLLLSKGASVLVDACRALAERGIAFRCHLVGRGQDEARLRAQINRLGLASRVLVAGPRPYSELPDWYRACDVVALPSFSEGIPNVLREAIACGRPFVATRVGGIPEIADSATSRLVTPGDRVALADAIEEFLVKPPTPDAFVSTGIQRSWEESASDLARVLQEAIDHWKAGIRVSGAASRAPRGEATRAATSTPGSPAARSTN